MDRTNSTENKSTNESILNTSYDREFGILATEGLGYDGVSLQRRISESMAMKVTTDGNVKYIAIASPGTSQATEKWQVQKVDTTNGVVITWADGDSNFDNVASDLTALSYS